MAKWECLQQLNIIVPALQTVEICTGPAPDASIIWLHGLGADGHDFAPIVGELRLQAQVRFIFPHAPQRPVTINGGYLMRAWYDIHTADIAEVQDETGIRASQALVEELICEEKARGTMARRILLAGFSQGGAIALQTGLRHPEALGGLIALSTYLPLANKLEEERSMANVNTPIFMAHGLSDSIIGIESGRASSRLLARSGYDVRWHEYPMSHTVCAEEVADIGSFINCVLG